MDQPLLLRLRPEVVVVGTEDGGITLKAPWGATALGHLGAAERAALDVLG